MKDINGTAIEVGQKIERVIDDGSSFVGRVYDVITCNFADGTGEGEDLCARAYDQTILLYPERTKQFKVVS